MSFSIILLRRQITLQESCFKQRKKGEYVYASCLIDISACISNRNLKLRVVKIRRLIPLIPHHLPKPSLLSVFPNSANGVIIHPEAGAKNLAVTFILLFSSPHSNHVLSALSTKYIPNR